MSHEQTQRHARPAVISTYVPRRCGIATFAYDLVTAYNGQTKEQKKPLVVAVSNPKSQCAYPREVAYEIGRDHVEDYVRAAQFLNGSPIDIVSIQHEYGIFGGEDGKHIVTLANELKKPFSVTCHTVLKKPSNGQLSRLKQLCERASSVIVLSDEAILTMKSVYGIDPAKVVCARHGAPDLPFTDPEFFKDALGLAGRTVLLTFGHLGPGKGIETGIRALKRCVAKIPNIMYLVVGATHPELLKYEGERYRESLVQLADELGVAENVRFINKYLTSKEVLEYVQAADIYLSPYPVADQISSGPLAYAVAAGKVVISTPYVAAKELLADGRGLLAEFNSDESFADNIVAACTDPVRAVRMRKAAYRFGRDFTWSSIGDAYARLFAGVVDRGSNSSSARPISPSGLCPKLPLWDHLVAMTDDTGVFQHAKYSVPDRSHGYCTDDVARSLLVACRDLRLSREPTWLHNARSWTSFLYHAFDRETGRMRNFMSFERRWLEKTGSEDSHARSVWATGYVAAHCPDDGCSRTCFELFHELLPALAKFRSPRAWAYSILGIAEYLSKYEGDLEAKKTGALLADRLVDLYNKAAEGDWRWFEPVVAYDNAKLSEALLRASSWDDESRYENVGFATLEWLFTSLTDPSTGAIWLVGNRGWWRKDQEAAVARFDQQPIDAAGMVSAAKCAYELTRDPIWRERLLRSFEWFLGRNDLGISLVDSRTGACGDGLTPTGVNGNQGAESTLSWMNAQYDLLESGVIGVAATAAELQAATNAKKTA